MSCCLDNIDSYILKLAKYELDPAIKHMINKIIKSYFPKQWKWAKVIPLHKKDFQILPENYRPVVLLCIISNFLRKLFSSN